MIVQKPNDQKHQTLWTNGLSVFTELLLEITYMIFYLNREQISFIIKSFGKFFEDLLNSHMLGVNNQARDTHTDTPIHSVSR